MKPWARLLALCLATAAAVRAADRGIAVKAAREAGIANYDPERCHALIIGINRYRHWPNLRTAANDAIAFSDTLKQRFGYQRVTLLLNDDATRLGILQALDGFSELGEGDSLIVYFAGHGWMDSRRNGFWVPSEAPRENKFAYIANSRIVGDYFKKYSVKHLLVIADSCFSGALMRGSAVTRGRDWRLPSGFRKPSRWVLTSGDLAPVPDDAGGDHSPFASRVLQFLRYSDDPAFGVQDLYVYVRKNLETTPLCEPLRCPQHMPGGEYVFCRMDAPPVKERIPDFHSFTPSVTLPTAPPTMSIAPAPRPAPAATIQAAPAPPPTAPGKGTVTITSPVSGIASIDRKNAQRIRAGDPKTWTRVASGLHKIRVVSGTSTWEKDVVVQAGQVTALEASFPSESAPSAKPVRPVVKITPKLYYQQPSSSPESADEDERRKRPRMH